MKQAALLGVALGLLAVACGSAAAQPVEDRLNSAQALLDTGRFEEAAAAARAALSGVKDEQAKTRGMVLLATALRKAGDWQAAGKAYGTLKDRYEKGTESFVRYEATAEVVQASPKGTYPPLLKKTGESADKARTLADDAVLAEALAALGEQRAAALKAAFTAEAKKSVSGKEIAAKFAQTIDGLSQARFLCPSLPVQMDQDVAAAAATGLERLEKERVGPVRTRLGEIEQAATARHTITAAQRTQLTECQAVCTDMLDGEKSFLETLEKVPREGWTDGWRLRGSSAKRTFEYNGLVRTCRVLQAVGMFDRR